MPDTDDRAENKISSLIDCINETDTKIAFVTETWLRDGQDLEEDATDLSAGEGLGMLARNRNSPAANRVTYGGVAKLWKEASCSFKEIKLKDLTIDNFELLVCAGSMCEHTRKVCLIAAYLPPNFSRIKVNQALDKITEIIVALKR